MNRRDLLRLAAVGGVASLLASGCTKYMQESSASAAGEVEEADIARLGKSSSVALTAEYLERIGKIDKSGPALNSIIEINPDALSEARKLDEERKNIGPRGPLHGIPVL